MKNWNKVIPQLAFIASVLATQVIVPAPAADHAAHNARTIENLSTFIDLPYLPHYTGRWTFIDGTTIKGSSNQDTTVIINATSKEDPDIVHGWYEQVLQANQWKIMTQSSDNETLMALHGNSTCTVIARKCLTPKMRSSVAIIYRIRP